jgi:SAM-dependent methyltransferase
MIFEFYDPELYQLGVGSTDLSATEGIEYYQELVGAAPCRILDIGAGYGRVAIPLLKSGHHVVCVESSTQMFSALCKAIENLPNNLKRRVDLLHEPFQKSVEGRSADVGIGVDDFLLHWLTFADLEKFFRALRTWLPGGRFLTDIRPRSNDELMAQSARPSTVRTFGVVPSDRSLRGASMIFWEEYNPGSRHLRTTCEYQILTEDGTVSRAFYRILDQRVHTNEEIVRAASNAGVVLIEHSARFRPKQPPNSEIGGSFIFEVGE